MDCCIQAMTGRPGGYFELRSQSGHRHYRKKQQERLASKPNAAAAPVAFPAQGTGLRSTAARCVVGFGPI
jgi:hypothetical protein